MRRFVFVIAAAIIGIVIPVAAAARSTAASGDPAAMESEFVSRINALRASKGLGQLAVDGELTSIARRWAGKMAAAGGISHNPNFSNEVTADWVKLGENVGTGGEVVRIHDAFVASSRHYANMVDPAFTRIGVGVVVASNGAIYTAHQFMRLASDDAARVAAAAPAPSPAPAPAAPRAPRPARSAAPRPAPAPAPAPAAAVAPEPPAAPPAPAPVMPVRLALALEQLQGRGL
jgi:hypothetical protein